jgi:hypothetical protein
MGEFGRRSQVILLVILFIIGLDPGALSVGPGEEDRSFGPHADYEAWSDSLDDLGRVYVPPSGLVGVEVSGGDAHLKSGSDDGWIASEIISAPAGYRYDMLLLEIDTPGASSVQVSILNASADPSEIGFANETIPGFRLADVTEDEPYLSVYQIAPRMFPEVRIQVTMHASGTDRPRLLAWRLEFIGPEIWRDGFWNTGKMSKHSGLNLSGGGLEVNLSMRTGSGGTGYYEPFPPLAATTYDGELSAYYPNAARNGYQDCVVYTGTDAYYTDFADFDGDGDMDLLSAPYQTGTAVIYWTGPDGKLSMTGTTDFTTGYNRGATTGDFNGDGWPDFYLYGPGGSEIWLNQGDGVFGSQGDITLPVGGIYTCAGDFNNDGYDDIIMMSTTNIVGFFGGPSGPDTTADITFAAVSTQLVPADLDQDGHLDLLLLGNYENPAKVYMGGPGGPDGTADYTFTGSDGVWSIDAGDMNGDGYYEIAYPNYDGTWNMWIYKGSPLGWSSSRMHKIPIPSIQGGMSMADVDLDGYSDILYTCWNPGAGSNTLRIYKGGTTWPTSHSLQKSGEAYNRHSIAIPRGASDSRYVGRFTTETIDLPVAQGKRWDIVHMEGTMPLNTSMKLSVLNETGSPIAGYEDLTDWTVDISGLHPILQRTIQVKVTIESEFNNTTPILDSLMVKWMDEMTWRDEFYGPARVEGLLDLKVADGRLTAAGPAGAGPQLVFPSMRGDENFTTTPKVYSDAGGLDYLSRAPGTFAIAVDVADVNGDGHIDMVFAVHHKGVTYQTKSPLYLGSPIGMRTTPYHEFPTTGATDVLLRDLNEDGYMDVVFAQEENDGYYLIDSTLFWGSESGWNSTPDVEFVTTGATGVDAADFDGDGLDDLVFSCYKDATSTATDSMAFLQTSTGFNGTSPSLRFPTKGARAVATGDLNDDTHVDVVFANSISGGMAEIDSYVYWGIGSGSFSIDPKGLLTSSAQDVALADVDVDGDMDVVFANQRDNTGGYNAPSYVYLNDGSGGFGSVPDRAFPTKGAMAVTVADIDGNGWRDVVFACERDGSTYRVPSMVYLGGASGWGSSPDIELPTEGATDVAVARLVGHGSGGYLSTVITPEDPGNTGAFHTFRYTADLGASISGKLQLVDHETWEVLAETPLVSGTHEWVVEDLIKVKAHPSIRVGVVLSGLETGGAFGLDDLWLNWTDRVERIPEVTGMEVESASVYRAEETVLWIDVKDEYDLTRELQVVVQHRLNGTTGSWETYLLGSMEFDRDMERWMVTVRPRVSALLGVFDFRANVRDKDLMTSPWMEFPGVLEVLNNLPSAPEVRITPSKALTTSTLEAMIETASLDVETPSVTYHYKWYRNGVPVENATDKTLSSFYTSKGQNWSVEVRAFDGEEEGPPSVAWRMIDNTPPQVKGDLPDPEFDEDTTDTNWLDLSLAFEDPDGDALTWSLMEEDENLAVTIDPETGQVTMVPDPDWSGEAILTFLASDGEFNVTQTVTVRVVPVNDVPTFVTIDGRPVSGGPIEYTIKQGERLEIRFETADVEGDEVLATVNTSAVVLDVGAGLIAFEPDNDDVGVLHFSLTIYDDVSPNLKVTLDFIITVENENDPMENLQISNPGTGARFFVNQSFLLTATCDDPDLIFGQVLTYTWESNISGVLGHGSSLEISMTDVGTHLITVTVRDPDYEMSVTIEVQIRTRQNGPPPPPPPSDDTEGLNWTMMLGVIAVLVVVGAVFFVLTSRRRTDAMEGSGGADYMPEPTAPAPEAVTAPPGHPKVEEEMAKTAREYEEIEIETDAIPSTGLSMEVSKTEAASEETQKLFAGISETEKSPEEKEALRMDNLKRKYQNAIGRLPYGIPSKELAERDWVDLASALATGEKKGLPDGSEATEIDGRWYYSDPDDTGTFLKEHGAKPKEKKEPSKKVTAPAPDKEKLLAKLEERFIQGEITEAAYNELKGKYS